MSHVALLYNGYAKELEGSFKKRVGHCPSIYVSASLSLGRPISSKLAETVVKQNKTNNPNQYFIKLHKRILLYNMYVYIYPVFIFSAFENVFINVVTDFVKNYLTNKNNIL